MYRRQVSEEIPEENTKVWSCTNDDCKGWMRDDFAFESEPQCSLCSSPMEREMRMLPVLSNAANDLKAMRKG
ncbi:hypothetical protein J45TS6_08400 [Paenibacillus sp. J45TS6]|uniref:cold-shock protein n=1 Tax=unclassified Paenibacillus TaxID=185978 RepID=UPI001B18E12B|nr:cold-shock protein [Paenibacillus sp. J45TS6]GIP42381.1 hypothetical protein J45TS6_08400 [Paenibacillus sp. J45TS6]